MFIAVIETGSFAAAAKRLGVSPGQASKMVSRLERDLKVNLISRSTRSLTPTEIGRNYYEQISKLITNYDTLNDSILNSSKAPSGVLRISAPVTFGTQQLSDAMIKFVSLYPDIELDVRFADHLVNLIDEGFDLALRIGKLEDSSLVASKIGNIRIVLVASPAYLNLHGSPETWQDISSHNCIVDTNFQEPHQWSFLDHKRQEVVQPIKGELNFSNAEVCLRATIAGLGISRLPLFVVNEAIQKGELKTILADYEATPLGLYILYPTAKYIAQKSRVFIDFLKDFYSGKF